MNKFTLGYVLKNHLGNVLAVVTDRKLVKPYVSGAFDGFESDLVSHSSYYPFGMEIENLSANSSDYSFGFNGMKKDSEGCGCPNEYTSHFRAFDTRLARWKSIDPEVKNFPAWSPYNNNLNNPIYNTDPNGNCPWCVVGAVVGGVGGFAYGAFKYGFKDGGWKKTLASTVAGGLGGATMGLSTLAISAVATAGAASATGTLFITGGTAIVAYNVEDIAEQNLNILFGSQEKWNYEQSTATIMTSLPAALLGGVLDKVTLGGTELLTKKLAKDIGEEQAWKSQKIWIKETAKEIQSSVVTSGGGKVSAKEAKKAAERMFSNHLETGLETMQQIAVFKKKSIQIGTSVAGNAISGDMKDSNTQENKEN